MPSKSSGPKGLLYIAAFKLLKGLLLLAIAIGALHLLHKDVDASVAQWINFLRVDPENIFIHRLLERLSIIDDHRLKELSIGTFLFSALSLTEGIGLATLHASGFIYVVSVTGVTGARAALATGLREYVERVRAKANGKPIALGFGISTAEQVREVGQFVDGVIVGAALIRAAGDAPDPAQAAYEFVRGLSN